MRPATRPPRTNRVTLIRMRQRLSETFARETGQPLDKVIRDTERNYWMSAEEAVAYGLASRVINNATEIDRTLSATLPWRRRFLLCHAVDTAAADNEVIGRKRNDPPAGKDP